MEEKSEPSAVAMYITRGCLVVPIQTELYDEVILQVQREILEKVSDTGAKGVIIDVSGVEIIDSFLSQALIDTARMLSLLGSKAVLTGMRPGVAASLVDLDFELMGVQTALTLEHGLQSIESISEKKEEPEEAREAMEENVEAEDDIADGGGASEAEEDER